MYVLGARSWRHPWRPMPHGKYLRAAYCRAGKGKAVVAYYPLVIFGQLLQLVNHHHCWVLFSMEGADADRRRWLADSSIFFLLRVFLWISLDDLHDMTKS